MSINLKNLDEGLGIVFAGNGVVKGEEIIRANKTILSSVEKIKSSRYCIIDYSDIDEFDVSTNEINIIADQDKEIYKYNNNIIVAIVAKRDLEFGVSRMWESIIDNNDITWQVMIFKERNDADEWIRQKVMAKHDIRLSME